MPRPAQASVVVSLALAVAVSVAAFQERRGTASRAGESAPAGGVFVLNAGTLTVIDEVTVSVGATVRSADVARGGSLGRSPGR